MRSAFEKPISFMGLALVAVLIAAGGLLAWANTFIGDQVHDQLTMQQITMPEGEALASLPKADAEALEQYAGSPMDTGPEAKAFSDHYILAHMNASTEELAGEVMPYAAVSGKARELGAAVAENPNATQAEIDEAAEWGALSSRCSTATPCAACSSTATRSPPSAPSPVSPPSSRSLARPCSWCSSCSASGTLAGRSTLSGTPSRYEWLSTPEQGHASWMPSGIREVRLWSVFGGRLGGDAYGMSV